MGADDEMYRYTIYRKDQQICGIGTVEECLKAHEQVQGADGFEMTYIGKRSDLIADVYQQKQG